MGNLKQWTLKIQSEEVKGKAITSFSEMLKVPVIGQCYFLETSTNLATCTCNILALKVVARSSIAKNLAVLPEG